MVSYGYTLDHIVPDRRTTDVANRDPERRYPVGVCCAVILGASVALWAVLIEAAARVVH